MNLTDRVPLTGQEHDTEQVYRLSPISSGDVVTCTLTGSIGDADLDIYFKNEPSAGCSSYNVGSNEECVVGPAVNNTILFAEVLPYQPYTDLTITCSINLVAADPQSTSSFEGESIYLSPGVPLTDQAHDSEQQYILDPVAAGDYVTCTLNGDNGDADIEIFFENAPNNGCSSFNAGSEETCRVGPATSDTVLYAIVIAYQPYTDLSITCSISQSTAGPETLPPPSTGNIIS